MRRTYLVGLTWLAWTAACAAGSVEADPNKEYRLGPKDGPYLIYVASYRGEGDKDAADPIARRGAYEDARALVLELRSRYKVSAYIYSKSEQEKAERDKQIDDMKKRFGDGQPLKKIRIPDEWAVLIGNYPDYKSANDAAKDTIRKFDPPKSVHGESLYYVEPGKNNSSATLMRQEKNPFKHAFALRNPMIGADVQQASYEVQQSLVAKLDAYSLTKCAREFTVVVASVSYQEFEASSDKPGLLDRVRGSKPEPQQPQVNPKTAAAAKAIQIADVLRSRCAEYQVYVYPTEAEVLITMGAFNNPKSNSEDNRSLGMLVRLIREGRLGKDIQFRDPPVPMHVPH